MGYQRLDGATGAGATYDLAAGAIQNVRGTGTATLAFAGGGNLAVTSGDCPLGTKPGDTITIVGSDTHVTVES